MTQRSVWRNISILDIATHRYNEKVEECLKDLYRNFARINGG
jgi:hypothetical protein